MTRAKRERNARTDNWELIQQWCRHPEQLLYESIRPITLHSVSPAERVQETGLAESTLRRTADTFDELRLSLSNAGVARVQAPDQTLNALADQALERISTEHHASIHQGLALLQQALSELTEEVTEKGTSTCTAE